MLGRVENHISQDLRYRVVPVLGRYPQAVQFFVNDIEVVGTGVGFSEGWADNGYLVVWE